MKRTLLATAFAAATLTMFAGSAEAQLPDPGMVIDGRTALVLTDPQNDFLSPHGVAWGVVGQSVTENNTVANLETLLQTAKAVGMEVFISGRPSSPRSSPIGRPPRSPATTMSSSCLCRWSNRVSPARSTAR